MKTNLAILLLGLSPLAPAQPVLPPLELFSAPSAQPTDKPYHRPPMKGNLPHKPAGAIKGVEVNDNGECTSVKFEFASPTFGPTRTIYTSVSTTTETVDCGPCVTVVPDVLVMGVPPVAEFTTTVTAVEPSVTTEYACGAAQPTGQKEKRQGLDDLGDLVDAIEHARENDLWDKRAEADRFAATTITPPGASPTCTSQTQLDPSVPNSTETVYPSTVTSTSTVDCGDCALEYSTGILYFFAPIIQTATITAAEASTKIDLACATAEPDCD